MLQHLVPIDNTVLRDHGAFEIEVMSGKGGSPGAYLEGYICFWLGLEISASYLHVSYTKSSHFMDRSLCHQRLPLPWTDQESSLPYVASASQKESSSFTLWPGITSYG